MSRMALFTSPKPSVGARVAMIQSNALASWRQLGEVDILLLGDEAGIHAAASRADAVVVPGVRKNERGTPLISSMVELARSHSESPLLCIINTDMIMMQDFLEAAEAVQRLRQKFVLLGRRWDIDINAAVDFEGDWQKRLRAAVRERGKLHRPAGSDYFVFPRGCYLQIPDFAVGRAGWDNWMIYQARRAGWDVIDCTPSVMAVHQTHDYGHLPGGLPHYSMPESDENIRLAGGHGPIRYTILDATHVLEGAKLVRPRLTGARLLRLLEIFLRSIVAFLPARRVEDLVRPRRWRRRFERLVTGRDRKRHVVETGAEAAED